MANMHLLTRVGVLHRVVCHIPIPNVNNVAGVNYRTAMVNAGLVTPSVLPTGSGVAGTISATEATSLASGELVECVTLLDVTQGGTLATAAAIGAFLDEFYARLVLDVQAELQARLSLFGRVR